MEPLCVTRLTAALYSLEIGMSEATRAVRDFGNAYLQNSKRLPKVDRRRIGRMIRRGRIIRNGHTLNLIERP